MQQETCRDFMRGSRQILNYPNLHGCSIHASWDPTGAGAGGSEGAGVSPPRRVKTLPPKIFLVRIGRASCGVIAASTERRNGCSQSPIDGTRSRLEIEQSESSRGFESHPFRSFTCAASRAFPGSGNLPATGDLVPNKFPKRKVLTVKA